MDIDNRGRRETQAPRARAQAFPCRLRKAPEILQDRTSPAPAATPRVRYMYSAVPVHRLHRSGSSYVSALSPAGYPSHAHMLPPLKCAALGRLRNLGAP